MRIIESMIELFMRITTGILLVAAIFITVFWGWDNKLNVMILWQILLVAVVCTMGSLLFLLGNGKELSKKAMLGRMILYYIYINVAVLALGWYFEWYTLNNWQQVLGMVVAIAVVFFAVEIISYRAENRMAQRMNERLREREE